MSRSVLRDEAGVRVDGAFDSVTEMFLLRRRLNAHVEAIAAAP